MEPDVVLSVGALHAAGPPKATEVPDGLPHSPGYSWLSHAESVNDISH